MLGKWAWIGIGLCLTILLFGTMLCLCRLLSVYQGTQISLFKYMVTRKRINNVTVTVKREENASDYSTATLSTTSASPIQNLDHRSPYFEINSEQDFAFASINTHQTKHFKYVRKLSNNNQAPRKPNGKIYSQEEAHTRSMSRMLWQDLTMTTTDDAVMEAAYIQAKSINKPPVHAEQKKVYKTSRKVRRQAWGKNSVKIFLFAKLVSGYFTVNRSGKLCKVNDWKHVSGEDLRYREQAIFDLVCLNQLHIEVNIN